MNIGFDDADERKSKIKRTVNGKRICPECGGELVKRQNRNTREWFYGCANFANFAAGECLYTEPLPIDQQLRAAGAKTLPGM